MVTGNLATEDLDSRLTGGRNMVRVGSMCLRRSPHCPRETHMMVEWRFDREGHSWDWGPQRVDGILAPDLLCVPGATCWMPPKRTLLSCENLWGGVCVEAEGLDEVWLCHLLCEMPWANHLISFSCYNTRTIIPALFSLTGTFSERKRLKTWRWK